MNPKIKVNIGKGRPPVELQQCVDTDLKTESKTVTGAINELFETKDGSGDGEVGVGKVTDGNGEMFNDYENNKSLTEYSHAEGTKTIAGKMAHLIMSIPSTTQFELESVEGLAVGYVVSYAIPDKGNINAWAEKQDMGTITAIEGNIITLNTEITLLTNAHILEEYAGKPVREQRTIRRLWVNEHPEVGSYMLSMRAHAEGREARAIGDSSHAEGKGTRSIGAYSHSEGSSSKAFSESGHAEGRSTVVKSEASGGHAEGAYTEASAYASHAEGDNTKAIGHASHSEGHGTSSIGDYSHAEGANSIAEGNYSHAGGHVSKSLGVCSFAHGNGAIATGDGSIALGYYPEKDENGELLLNIGNGRADYDRSSALKLDFDGNLTLKGSITANNIYTKEQSDSTFATKDYIESYVNEAILGGAW